MSSFNARSLPVIKRLPCRGCRFLDDSHGGEYYGFCTYQIPGPFPYWRDPNAVGEIARWRNYKYMDGPFTDDVEDVVCDTREER